MTRRRWRITLLAAAATLAAVYPITSLFTKSDWLLPAVLTIAVVASAGLFMRGITRSRALVTLAQVVAAGYFVVATQAWSTFTFGLPTTRTLDLLGEYAKESLETMARYAVPAPLGEGITFWLVAAIALVAVSVDAIAATWRSPAAAGLPLLTAYLITAANGSDALAVRYFVLPVALWLAMLHISARAQFGRWSTTSATDAHGHDIASEDASSLRSLSGAAGKLGVIGIVVALAVPVLVPHFPARYLLDGLGRSSAGGGDGTVGFSDTLDLSRSLLNSDATPVLRYTTNASALSPLRVLATSYYSGGQWLAANGRKGNDQPVDPPSQRREYTMTVTENTLANRVAAPYPVLTVAMPGTQWRIDPVTRDVRVDTSVSTYRVTYADIVPAAALLREGGTPNGADVLHDDLTLPSSAADDVNQWAQQVAGSADNPLDKAIAIQTHLRDTSRYTYTLNLPEPERREDGTRIDPILTFRKTRQGYCVQFASAMIMLARAQGIPARMAIGFLPGVRLGDSYVVRAADAHAWPELYFGGVGWLRFEPTPSSRSGSPPAYTVVGSGTSPTGGGRPVDESGPAGGTATAKPRPEPADLGAGAADAADADAFQVLTLRGISIVLAGLVLVLAIFVMPLTAWISKARRRRRAATRQELVELEWDSLTSHLEDLGLSAPSGSTLRIQRDRYIHDALLDDQHATAMRRVTATLERVRYDRPERTTPEQADELHRDIRSIRREVSRTRSWNTRLRSFLWPDAGVSVWKGLRLRRWRRRP